MTATTDPSKRSRTARRAAAVLIVASVALASCSSKGGSDEAKDTTTTAEVTSTTEAATTTTEAPSTTAAEPSTTTADGGTTEGYGSLPEGTYQGYFRGLSDGTVEGQAVQVVAFDQVEMLTGDAADQAGREQGLIGEDEHMPNDYLIVDDDDSTILLPVIPDGVVTLLEPGGAVERPGSITEAAEDPDQLYEIEVVVVRDISLITATKAVYLP